MPKKEKVVTMSISSVNVKKWTRLEPSSSYNISLPNYHNCSQKCVLHRSNIPKPFWTAVRKVP